MTQTSNSQIVESLGKLEHSNYSLRQSHDSLRRSHDSLRQSHDGLRLSHDSLVIATRNIQKQLGDLATKQDLAIAIAATRGDIHQLGAKLDRFLKAVKN